uniref:MMS19 nucleotide excision repair protein n=1 Tax=Sinocyclocheilus rhinocerous TaxID=307959 RepID=A0A673GQF8_9TELE
MAADNSVLLGLVEEFVSGQVDSKAAETVTGSSEKSIVNVIHCLSSCRLSLTSSQPQTRGRGVQLLSQVLQECYSSLSERELEVLLAFYENRLKDHYVIIPHVLQGLNALTKCSVLPPGSAVSILRSIFQDLHVQSLMLAERSCVYNILVSLMESKEEELKGLGADFIYGFVQSVDGERDPRNLLLAFQVARNIIHRGYDLGKFVEELFEVMSCYFPIDFSPPPSDPHRITQEELVLSLRAVLTGTSQFAEFLLPLIIEKLDSDIQSAKVDSLQTLAACGLTYSHKELAKFLPGLWSSIQREVFQTASEGVESAGLSALSALVSCLSRSVLNSDSEDVLQVFLSLVLQDCQHHLCEPDLKLVWPSAKLLQAAAGASYRASLIVSAAVIPALLEQYNNETQVRSLLMYFSLCLLHKHTEDSVLVAFQQSLCSVVFSALTESGAGLQVTATRVLTALGQQPGLLAQTDVEKVVDHLTRLILEEDDTKVSLAVVECSGSLAHLHHKAFISRLIPRLKEEILSAVRQRCVTALASVSSLPSVVQESAPILLQVLASAHTGSCGFSVEEVVAVCISLQKIAEHVRDSEGIGRFFHDIIIPHLLGLCLQAALQSRDAGQLFERKKQHLWDSSCHSFTSRQVEIPEIDRLLVQLEDLSCTGPHLFSYTFAAKCFAGLVNKMPAGEALDAVLERVMKRISVELENVSSAQRTQAFTLLLWVSKALLLRYHPLSTALTDKLFALLSDPALGSQVADGFCVLMSDSLDVLNRNCHADVRIMYRQRFFAENTTKIIQGFNSAEQEKKSYYLKALSHIVSNLPRQVQLTELPVLLPLLLEALSCADQAVQLSTLSCLQPVLLEPPAAIRNQLEALFSRLLTLTTSPAMKVRIASLQCVHALSRLPEHMVLPFRARVLKALAVPLDDTKRLVRMEAMVARGEWFLLGSPGGR